MNTNTVTRLLLTSACALAALVGTSVRHACGNEPQGQTAPQRFFDWTQLQFSANEHQARRERAIESLRKAGGGVFLIPSRAGRSGGETFRQLDDFMYFTGLELPDSILAIDADADRTVLYAPRSDSRFESSTRPNDFPGRPLGTDPSIAEDSSIHEVRPIESLGAQIQSWRESGRVIWLNPGRRGPIERPAVEPTSSMSPTDTLLAFLNLSAPNLTIANAHSHIAALRMIKSPAEIETIRRACAITVEGIRHAASQIRDGVDERLLEGELELAFKRRGAQRVAFDSIIKSGPNSLWPWRILASHYDRRNRVMRRGDLVIFDVGCELNHYASDMGRTFPVSGRFTDKQRQVLAMVTAVSDAMIASIRPGVTLADVQAAGESKIPSEHRKYMQTRHYFGHHIGLSVGDLSLDNALLEPGMIFTVEPWYYNHDERIAVFIEDDVLVTATGVENLTKELPRSPEEVERMVVGPRPELLPTTPPNWRYERIDFPLSFAPELKYEGFEELSFAPRMFDAKSETYFTYIFAMKITNDVSFDAQLLKSFLETYFRGLCRTAAKGTKFDIDGSKITATVREDHYEVQHSRHFTVTLDSYDPFVTGEPLKLRLEMLVVESDENDHRIFAAVSPKPRESSVWTLLRGFKRKFQEQATRSGK